MITVTVELRDVTEFAGFAQFLQHLTQHRKAVAADAVGAPASASPPAAASAATPPAAAASAPTEEQLRQQVREAFEAYLRREGFAAARAKLDAYGARRIGDVPTEQLAAFLRDVSA